MPDEVAQAARYRIESFDPLKHDRTSFACGVAQIDNFLKLTAKKQQKDDFVRVRVLLDGSRLVGFHAINAHAVDAGDISGDLQKKAPRHGKVPAAYISMIGVDKEYQGRSLGRMLLVDALRQVLQAATVVGTAVVVLDILDDGDNEAMARRERYYRGFGFIPFPDHPRRLFLPTETIRQVVAS